MHTTMENKVVTQGMVISWGRLAGVILPFLVGIIIAIWQFRGDTKAAEVNMTNTVVSLTSALSEFKTELKSVIVELNKLRESASRADERLKSLEKGK